MTDARDSHSLKRRIRFWLLLPIIFVTGIYIAPSLQTTKGVTVLLDGCVTSDCELHGDLTVNLFTGMYTLRQSDGQEVTFSEDQITFIQLTD
ncbi:MAG: hypothetical protein R3175_03365 [Marinobacter sp.]|uniref:hypothetical protein n=1 Tax=Marinobacter sp. TaxID=50741 RepID=UPI00299D25F9|nr:hypothetical protein [Marinobacter sp.]MDX1755078.1 hypothetical protein [Marinobacter sp.]